MRIVFTGASSVAGRRVLERLLELAENIEVWCLRHKRELAIADARVRIIDLDLAGQFDEQSFPEAIDTAIHFAGVTHAWDARTYWNVNHRGTMRLAAAVRARGCRRFVYISTRCATPECDAYGKSKLAAENELKKFAWDSLLLIRPSEIYGGQGKEGVDKLIVMARRWHLTPWLFGNSRMAFAPLHLEDSAGIIAEEIITAPNQSRIVELCGPEDLSAGELTQRIAKRYKALPVPLWWPLFSLFVKVAARFNSGLAVPDQLQRLIGTKTSTAKSADRTGRVRFLQD